MTATFGSSSIIATPVTLQRNARTRPWSNSPVVLAMLSGNRMQSCKDVREVYSECLATASKDQICRSAAKYFEGCARGDPEC